MEKNEILLSICIPTYNRAKYLDLCLSQICKQVKPFEKEIQLIVSDNSSTDDTEAIVLKYIQLDNNIQYIKNKENIGADGNFEQCFRLAEGKYVWLFGDDDLLLDDYLKDIIDILRNKDCGNIYISNYWYNKDYLKDMPKSQNSFSYIEFDNILDHISKVNFWITFATGNIINKSILDKDFDSKRFLGTNLNHLHWIIKAQKNARCNVVVETRILACKGGNTGGYRLFKTFGSEFHRICKELSKELALPQKYTDAINNNLLQYFFPGFVILSKQQKKYSFQKESPKEILSSEFNSYFRYWIFIFPLFYLPKKIDSVYLYTIQKITKPFINY